MLKKVLISLLASVVIASMGASVFASNSSSTGEVPTAESSSDSSNLENTETTSSKADMSDLDDASQQTSESESSDAKKDSATPESAFNESDVEQSNVDLLPETTVDISGALNSVDLSADAIDVGSSNIRSTGKTFNISKSRTGNAITNKFGSLTGSLSTANTWDYYTFSSDSAFFSLSQIVTNNSNYTMTLATVNYAVGEITLTNYVTTANKQFIANIGAGDYAWVIQSANGTYANDYKLQYNMSLSTSDTPLYASSDLQKLYSIGGDKLRINNQVQNVDYAYDRDVEYPEISFWNRLHISMRNANVSAAHVGGVKYYAGSNLYNYPNAILLKMKPGGTFYHSFWQNPPHVHFVDKDMYKISTPRSINAEDINNRGAHYLIYNIDSGKVEEIASGLVQPWSSYGDRSDLAVY